MTTPPTPHWDTPVGDAKGQVTRDPNGVLYLEVQVGGDWWSLPVPAPATPALTAAIEKSADKPMTNNGAAYLYGAVCISCGYPPPSHRAGCTSPDNGPAGASRRPS